MFDISWAMLIGLWTKYCGHCHLIAPARAFCRFACMLRNLSFRTVERLSTILGDFLVLIPSYMDANRNERNYSAIGNRTVSDFLGNPEWRTAWSESHGEFGNFVVDQFGQSMKRLGFIYEGPGEEVPVFLPGKNVKLYHLAFFSKDPLGMRFWRQARKNTDSQLNLF